MKKKHALVVGASGSTGQELLKLLLENPDYNKVTIFLRREINIFHKKLNVHIIDFSKIYEYEDLIKGDVLFSALGTTLKEAGSKEKQYLVDFTYQFEFAKLASQDGVFSMDGYIAQLDKICDLADKYDALVMVDECHSTGFIGKNGRGTHEFCGVMGRVDIITGTLGKALGGAMGGFTSGKKEIIDILRQRSRPYLFSNSLAPSIVGASIQVVDLLSETTDLRDTLEENTKYFRSKMKEAGFDIKSGVHPIVPVMLYDAKLSQVMADKLLEEGIYVIGFFFPVVPKEQARIRVQISAAHTREHLDKAIAAFTKIGKELKIIN